MWSVVIVMVVFSSINADELHDAWHDVGSLYKTYYTSLAEVSWEKAAISCLNKGPGTRLATISTEIEQKLLNELFKGVQIHYWIGVYRLTPGNFSRFQAPYSDYFAWAKGEPNGADKEECVELIANVGVWNDKDCNTNRKFICESEKGSDTLRVCGSQYADWKYFNGHCYSATASLDSALDWNSAQEYCIERNSHLVSIHDPYEQDLVFNKLLKKNDSLHNLWAGLQYNNKSLSSSWSDGTSVIFSQLDPDTQETQGCVSLNLVYKYWSVNKCSLRLGFICKIPYDLTIGETTRKEEQPAVTNISKAVALTGLTAGVVINIFLSILLLIILAFLVKRWPGFPSVAACFNSKSSLTKWTTLKEEEVGVSNALCVDEAPLKS